MFTHHGSAKSEALILYDVPTNSSKNRYWNDGFVDGARYLAEHLDVLWQNTHDMDARAISGLVESRQPTVVILKSAFKWRVAQKWELACRRSRTVLNTPAVIVLSGVIPASQEDANVYQGLVYQTHWYGRTLPSHANAVHAYGINKHIMRTTHTRPLVRWDYLYVGTDGPAKRVDLILSKTGRLAIAGNIRSPTLKASLMNRGVELLGYVPYDVLPDIYRSAACVYIPADVRGGGERTMMEAIACGVPVEYEMDNEKLREVEQHASEWDSEYYGKQITACVLKAIRMRES